MDRVAFVQWLLMSLLVMDYAMLTAPRVLGRKGYEPRNGLWVGLLLGLVAALIGLFVFKPITYLILEIIQIVLGAVLDNIRIADDLAFGVSVGSSDNFLPIAFSVEGARTDTLEFIRAIMAGLITLVGGLITLNISWRFIPNQAQDASTVLPEGEDLKRNTRARQIAGRVWRIHYFMAIMVGMFALSALLWNVVKGTFTMTAVSNTVDPMTLTDGRPLEELSQEELAIILTSENRVSGARLRTLVGDYVMGIDRRTSREILNKRLEDVLDDDQIFADFPVDMTWETLGMPFLAIDGNRVISVDGVAVDALVTDTPEQSLANLDAFIGEAFTRAALEGRATVVIEIEEPAGVTVMELPVSAQTQLFELQIPLIPESDIQLETSYIDGLEQDGDLPPNTLAAVDILGHNVDRDVLAEIAEKHFLDQGLLRYFIISRFFNEQREITDFSRAQVFQIAEDFIDTSSPEDLIGPEINATANIITASDVAGTGEYINPTAVEEITRGALAELDDAALWQRATQALSPEQLEQFDEADFDREALIDTLVDRYVYGEGDEPLSQQAALGRQVLYKGYIDGLSADDVRSLLRETLDSFSYRSIRQLAAKQIVLSDEEYLLEVAGGPELSEIEFGSYEYAQALVDCADIPEIVSDIGASLQCEGLGAAEMQALVLDLVLDGQEPDPSATLGEILTDDQTPLGSLERITYLRLRDNPLVVRRLFQENVSREQLEILVTAEIVKPRVVQTWTLDIALLNRDQIDEDLAETNRLRAEEAEENNTVWNDAELEFRSWIDVDFFTRSLNFDAELTGMRNAILGTIYMILITIAFAFPIGIGAAIYLEEYAGDSLISRVIQTNIDNLAGVPSIIYGLLGVTLFVRTLEPLTSGSLFGFTDPTTANGRTILSASLTMALLILPIIIINAQEAIQAVQPSIRQASYGLGATKWQTVRSHVLPSAMPGILTGTILAMSRAIGETAPLIVVGAATFIVADPSGPFSKFTALPMQIYFWTTQPRDADKAVAAAAIVILLAVLLTLNSTAIVLRNRFERRLRGK